MEVKGIIWTVMTNAERNRQLDTHVEVTGSPFCVVVIVVSCTTTTVTGIGVSVTVGKVMVAPDSTTVTV